VFLSQQRIEMSLFSLLPETVEDVELRERTPTRPQVKTVVDKRVNQRLEDDPERVLCERHEGSPLSCNLDAGFQRVSTPVIVMQEMTIALRSGTIPIFIIAEPL